MSDSAFENANPELPHTIDFCPGRPWNPRTRAALNESPWAKVGEIEVFTGNLVVCDETIQDDINEAIVNVPPGTYLIGTRSCETNEGRITTQVRLAKHLGGTRGDWHEKFEVESGNFWVGERNWYQTVWLNIATIFGTGVFRVHEVRDETGRIGIEVDLFEFDSGQPDSYLVLAESEALPAGRAAAAET